MHEKYLKSFSTAALPHERKRKGSMLKNIHLIT